MQLTTSTAKLNRYLALTCLTWIVCVLAIKPLRAQDQQIVGSAQMHATPVTVPDPKEITVPDNYKVHPRDEQIAELKARVADLERRVCREMTSCA